MIYSKEHITIAIPITKADRQKAKEFAQQQPTAEKQEQVERNTLAVLVMHYYLEMLEIPTDLKASHCWNPVGRLFADVADLYIPEVRGRLECRSIREGDNTCFIPQEVWKDRIGYVVVQLNESYKEGTVLGFVPAVSTTMLGLSQLQPLDRLIDKLDSSVTPPPIVQLHRWFDNIFEVGWQAVEELSELFNTYTLSPAIPCREPRSSREIDDSENLKWLIEQLYANQPNRDQSETKTLPDPDPSTALIHLIQTTQDEETRWQATELLWKIDPDNPAGGIKRLMDLGMELGGHEIALMVAILRKSDQKMAILVRVCPISSKTHLPPGLRLIVLDEAGNPRRETQARTRDNYIQRKFSAELGERFGVRVALEEVSITESFIV